MNAALTLRERSEAEASRLPPLLARAEHLAGTVLLGDHGRRRSGMGDDFWQYRPAQLGDSRRMIDHRRSARGDQQFVREREWQIAQSIMLWVDQGASMRFASDKGLPTKADRARLLGLATAILLVRGGERVGLTGTSLPPRRGNAQIVRLAQAWSEDAEADYAPPEHKAMIPHARAVFLSDFLGPLGEVELAVLELMAQEVDIAGGVTESLGNDVRRQTLDEGRAQGFVASLPVATRMGEEGSIGHEDAYRIWRIRCQSIKC